MQCHERQGTFRDARVPRLPFDRRGGGKIGGDFAANLSRIGEKTNYNSWCAGFTIPPS